MDATRDRFVRGSTDIRSKLPIFGPEGFQVRTEPRIASNFEPCQKCEAMKECLKPGSDGAHAPQDEAFSRDLASLKAAGTKLTSVNV